MATTPDALTTARPRVGRLEGARGHAFWFGICGLVALAGALVLGVGLGSVAVAPGDTVAILAHRLLGLDVHATWAESAETIVMDLRLPRVLTTMLVGIGLAVAGVTFQGLLRNPLADPYVLGTAS